MIGSHKIFCYITLHPGRDFFLPFFTHVHRLYDAAVFARLARWQLYLRPKVFIDTKSLFYFQSMIGHVNINLYWAPLPVPSFNYICL